MKIIFDVKKNLGILIILLSVFLVACSNDQVEVVEENKEVVSINVESLKFNIRRIPKIFIDAKEGDESALIIANNVYEGLMRETETGIEQAMAKNIAISDDYKKYTFTLRESYWSDGQVVKAQDFKNHIDQRLSESSVTDFVNLIGLESVVALDDRTLELKLSKSNTTFLDYLAEPEFFPKRVDTAEEVFNGPFRVSEIGKSHIRLEKNEMYWDSENINLESIEGAHIKIEEAVKKYSKDELDVVIDISSNYVEEKIISEENFIVFPQDSLYYYIFNEDKLGFSDSNEDKSVVRRKLFSAIDRTAIVENLNDVVMTLETLVVPKKILERDEDRFAFRQIIDSSIEQGATRYADYDELENPDEVIEITLRNNSPDEYAISTMVRDMW